MIDTKEYKPKIFRSSGGLGDSFIIYLKLLDYLRENPKTLIQWIHTESNDIEKPLSELLQVINSTSQIFVLFQYDPNYTQTIREFIQKRKLGKEVIPTPVIGKCNFYQKEWPLKNPFLNLKETEKEYDIVLQASGGFNNEREWKIHPIKIAEALASMGYHVTIVGTGKKYKSLSNNPEKYINLVDRTKLSDVLQIILKAKLFIGMSGLLNYFASAAKIPNIHVIESEEHEKTYFHPEWQKYTKGIKFGHLTNIVQALNLMKKEKYYE